MLCSHCAQILFTYADHVKFATIIDFFELISSYYSLVNRRNFTPAPGLCKDQSQQHRSLKFIPRGKILSVSSRSGSPCSSGSLYCRSAALLCFIAGDGRECAQLVLAPGTDGGRQASLH